MAVLSIRAALLDDAAEISAVVERAVSLTNSADYKPAIIDLICANSTPERILAKMRDRDVFVCHLGDQCVGTISLGSAKLHSLFVEPDLQRNGIGAGLVAHIEQHARGKGLQELHLSSSITARLFYERLGYTMVAFEERKDGSTYLMDKRLRP